MAAFVAVVKRVSLKLEEGKGIGEIILEVADWPESTCRLLCEAEVQRWPVQIIVGELAIPQPPMAVPLGR